ncbi:Prefoldin subunit 5, partial [Linum grandiflorum]
SPLITLLCSFRSRSIRHRKRRRRNIFFFPVDGAHLGFSTAIEDLRPTFSQRYCFPVVKRAPEMDKLTVEQLKAVKEQTDLEVNLLQDSLTNIRTATTRLDLASSALHDLSLRPKGKKMLVPLTASLYVPGTLDDSDNVLVDIGTGYFVEKTMVEGKDYCERKINLLKSNYDQLLELASKKKSVADEAGVVLQAKLKQMAAPSP